MNVKGIIHEDFVNYKKPSMFINTSKCSFKCDRECGKPVCQNSALANSPTHNIMDAEIIEAYKNNKITKAIVIGGLEPFDTPDELKGFIWGARLRGVDDDIVIYTGYTEEESKEMVAELYRGIENLNNIIIKFGRYIPDSTSRYDEVLGVTLASNNQYAKKIS